MGRGDGCGRDERVCGKDGWEGKGRMYEYSCEGNALIPQTVVGRKRPSFLILFASPYPASLQCCIDAMLCHTPNVTPHNPDPLRTCEIRPVRE